MKPYDQFYKDIQALVAAGKSREVITNYRAYLRQTNSTPVMLHNFAAILGDVGHHEEAVKTCREAFAKGLDAPETWLIYARSLLGCHRLDDAQAAFLKLLSKRPLDYVAHKEFAQLVWMRTNDASAAIDFIDKTIQKHSADLALKVIKAQILGFTGDAHAEFEALKACLNMNGVPDAGWEFYIRAAINAGEFEHALGFAEKGLTQIGGQSGEQFSFRKFIVQAHLALGSADKALSHIELLLKSAPTNQYYIALLATAYRLLGDERYKVYFDYEKLIVGCPLSVPQGWKNLDHYIDDLIEALDEMHAFNAHPFGLSVRHGSQLSSIEQMDHRALKAYPEAAAGALQHYIETVYQAHQDNGPLGRLGDKQATLLAAWSVSLPSGGFHVNHVHPQGWLSSACHLRKADRVEKQPRAGWLKFGGAGLVTKPVLEDEYFCEPEIGTMVIFPSYLWHGTMPFDGETKRLTIAADFT